MGQRHERHSGRQDRNGNVDKNLTATEEEQTNSKVSKLQPMGQICLFGHGRLVSQQSFVYFSNYFLKSNVL